jgi:hypothetical protein
MDPLCRPEHLAAGDVPPRGRLHHWANRLFPYPLNGDTGMSKLTALTTFMVLAVSSAWAQTPAPAPAPGAAPGSPPAGDAGATGGLADYWWVILLVVIVAAAIWYFTRGRNRV